MTTFGLDVSRFQNINLGAAAKQGYDFFAAKVTEGQGYVDATYAGNLAEAKSAGALFAAYHFLHSDSSAASQADNIAKHIIDTSVPVMIDCEPSGSSKPTLAQANALRSELAKRSIRATILYFPNFWWTQEGRPSLKGWAVWQARYPSSKTGFGSTLYLNAGGDKGSGWAAEGGVTPTIWQFASSAQVSGVAGSVDVDAFRGTRAELAATGIFKDFAPHAVKKPKPPVVAPPVVNKPVTPPVVTPPVVVPPKPVVSAVDTVIAIAKAEVGYHEGRNADGTWNNHEKYAPGVPTLEWAQNQPWCATFVSWVALKAGVSSLYPRTASCDVAGDWFKKKNRWSEYPAIGAQVFYGKTTDLNHTGIVTDYNDRYIWTVEGNTNDNGSREGDGVYVKQRERRSANVIGYGYPEFPEGIKNADPTRQNLNPKPAPVTAKSVHGPHVLNKVEQARALLVEAVKGGRTGRVKAALAILPKN